MSKIDAYSFGSIMVDGTEFHNDIIILPDKIVPDWWRKNGHGLEPEDLEDVIKAKPEVFIMGTGAMGALNVPSHTIEFLKAKGIELIALKTGDACNKYNQLAGKKRIAGGFHLTC